MSKDKEMIEAFLQQMRREHGEEIGAIYLPDGTEEYLREKVAAGDTDTIAFMMRLAYLMGLQTGYAAHESDEHDSPFIQQRGSIKA